MRPGRGVAEWHMLPSCWNSLHTLLVARASCGIRLLSKVFGQNCSKTPNMGWIVDWRGWEGPEVPGMEVRFFPMAACSTVRGSQLEED